MADTGTTGEAFLADLTQTLTASGWTRTQRNHFAMATPQFTHPDTPAAYLLHDQADTCWRVACDNPHPAVLAVAANATLANGSTSVDCPNRPLTELLREAGWTSEHESDCTNQSLGSRWTNPDGTEAVCFLSSTLTVYERAAIRHPGNYAIIHNVTRDSDLSTQGRATSQVRWGLFRTPVVRHARSHPLSRLLLPPVRPIGLGRPGSTC